MFFYIYEKQYLSKHDICVINATYMRRANFSARRTVTFHPCVFPVWQNRTRLSMVLPIPYVRRSVLSPRDQEKRRQIISLYGFPVRVHRSGGNDTVSRVLSSLIYRRECDTIPRACDTMGTSARYTESPNDSDPPCVLSARSWPDSALHRYETPYDPRFAYMDAKEIIASSNIYIIYIYSWTKLTHIFFYFFF